MTNRMAQIVAGCAAIFYLLFSLPPVWFIDKVGRRPAMMCGAAGLTIVNILLCVGFNIPGTKGTILIVVMYFLYYAAFALSFLNVSWIYPPEINSLKMRSMGASLASCSNWLCKSIPVKLDSNDRVPRTKYQKLTSHLLLVNGISVTITPIALDSIGWKFYLMWAVFNFSFIPMIYFFYPETKGLHLEQIDHIFEEGCTGWGHLTQGVRESVYSPRMAHREPGLQERKGSDEEKALEDSSERTSQKSKTDGPAAMNIEHAPQRG